MKQDWIYKSLLKNYWPAQESLQKKIWRLVRFCNACHTDNFAAPSRSWTIAGYLKIMTFISKNNLFQFYSALFWRMFINYLRYFLLIFYTWIWFVSLDHTPFTLFLFLSFFSSLIFRYHFSYLFFTYRSPPFLFLFITSTTSTSKFRLPHVIVYRLDLRSLSIGFNKLAQTCLTL